MMKLKNILVAGLTLICLTTACSKDEDKGPSSASEAKINVKIAASGLPTKADDMERLPGEAIINNIAAIVFSEDGSELLGVPLWQEMNAEGSATILNIPAKALKAQILLLANCPNNIFDGVSNYAAMQSKLAQLAGQKQTNLTMSSQLIKTIEALQKDDNFLGYEAMGNTNINGITEPLELTRLAARLDLINVTTTFSGSKLAGRTVRIDEISIGNMKTASSYFSEGYWGAVMVDGNLGTSVATAVNRQISDTNPVKEVAYRNYVMENTNVDAPTQLRIKATILEIPGYGAETKIFTATVNQNGVVVVGEKHKYVKRNYVYRISVNFGGNSFSGDPEPPTPPEPPVVDPDDTASLDVQVEVVGWGDVNQPVEIE